MKISATRAWDEPWTASRGALEGFLEFLSTEWRTKDVTGFLLYTSLFFTSYYCRSEQEPFQSCDSNWTNELFVVSFRFWLLRNHKAWVQKLGRCCFSPPNSGYLPAKTNFSFILRSSYVFWGDNFCIFIFKKNLRLTAGTHLKDSTASETYNLSLITNESTSPACQIN